MRVVWKVGGSVLSHPSLRKHLKLWSEVWPGCNAGWLVGGGTAADAVREWDTRHRLGDELSHRLALTAMDLNAELVAALLPGARMARSGPQCETAWTEKHPVVFCPQCVVGWGESVSGAQLPRCWDLTSDSIAAWLATQFSAERLVLVKSVAPPGNVAASIEQGYVDPMFWQYSERIPSVWTVTMDDPQPRVWFEVR